MLQTVAVESFPLEAGDGAALLRLLPLSGSLLQARWSGEAAWMPLGSLDIGVGAENDTQRPTPGQILVHPNGISETEILIRMGRPSLPARPVRCAGTT